MVFMNKVICIETIGENLQKCWDEYTYYVEKFRKEHYSNQKPMDFVEWCECELVICPVCEQVVLKDEISDSPLNTDNVCQYCKEDGYYE